ncbi:hypothetical protein, partial [uncultured Thiodictyon sp.]|uniref:hypothetical protein n=1 Tax=uncultured Thiodictyon sp. TaxID=1846217 RepID=UPI0025E0FFED
MPSPAAVPTGPTRPLPSAAPAPVRLDRCQRAVSNSPFGGKEEDGIESNLLFSLKVAQRRCGSGFSRDGPRKR